MLFSEWLITEENKHKFSSVQFNLPKELTKRINSWSRSHIPNKVLTIDGRETESHVTVLYGIHSDSPEDAIKILKSVKPFEITIGKVSKFSNGSDVIKLEIGGKKLLDLNKKLSRLEHTNKYDNYCPHCTLAYVDKGSCDHIIGKKPFDKKVMVDEVIFSSKNGKKTVIKLID